MKLSSAQQAVMAKMSTTSPQSAYDLKCSTATLEALQKKGLIKNVSGGGNLGRMFSPRTVVVYVAT